jgi:hypothetical protein
MFNGRKIALRGLIRTLQGNKNVLVKYVDLYIRVLGGVFEIDSQLKQKVVHFVD